MEQGLAPHGGQSIGDSVVIFIGDVHGKYKRYKGILRSSSGPTIQMGDMGVGFRKFPHGEEGGNPPYYLMEPGGHRFIRGNHDNPGACRKHSQWIEDGHVEQGMMFIGGATSIDRAMRIEGYSWWPDEECSTEQLYALTDKFVETKPRVMVTHDCPQDVAVELFGLHYKQDLEPGGTRTRQAFQSMWSAHSPKLWVFGHWHQSRDIEIRGTRFVCLEELEARDLPID